MGRTMRHALRYACTATPLLILPLFLPGTISAQGQADRDAVNRLLDQYTSFEEAMDMTAQSSLLSENRVWIAQAAGRRTDQAKNMEIQQAQMTLLKETMPGLTWFVEDRDRLIRFHANGMVAIASFFRYSTYLIPPGTPPDVSEGLTAVPASAFTLVLEKVDAEWKIVHTHISNLGPPAAG